jgi:hypothetical protein
MTAVASSVAPIDRRNLINAILELPEKDFWDLIDLRLNRPKGLRRLTNILGEEYIEIIDANDKPSIVERLTEAALVDELAFQLATTKSVVSHNGRCGIVVHKYYDQAFALRRYIPIARPAPKFVVHLSDLSTRVVAELWCLEDPQQVLKQAVGRIFENIDELQYHQGIARKLKAELVK